MPKSTSHKNNSKLQRKKRKDKERLRKIKQQKLEAKKLQKEMAKNLSTLENIISTMPSECSSCEKSFDNTNSEHLDKWIMAGSEQGLVLTCDACQESEDV